MSTTNSAEDFLRKRTPVWEELATRLQGTRLSRRSPEEISKIAHLYRELCTDLVRAQRLGCNPQTILHLDTIVSRAHSALYSEGGTPLLRLGQLLGAGFPRALRENWRLFLVASVLFWLPFGVALYRSLLSENFAAQVLPMEMLQQMAEAYQKDPSEGRNAGNNAAMSGFYVYNNVGIAFRCFATGILFGLGSAFFLVYNGVVTGAVMGHVIRTGGGFNILTFVCGHAPLELGAIVISGAAGLQMGHALVVTQGRSRLGSLWASRGKILVQILGAAVMLLLAALVEGFWSPSRAPAEVKWIVGAGFLVLVSAYLGVAGRSPGETRKSARKEAV